MTYHHHITWEEKEQLKQLRLKKHNLVNILVHWFNVACWAFLLPTGLAVILSHHFRVYGDQWPRFLRSMFGGLANLIYYHRTVGIVWLIVLTFNVLFGLRKHFNPIQSRLLWFDKDDLMWFPKKGLQLFGFPVELPPQDAYNAGQKAYSVLAIGGIIVIGLTGLIMSYAAYMPARWIVQWALPLHFAAVGFVIAGVIIHVYMGAMFPEEKSAFMSMFTSYVDGLYSYSHHLKFYQQRMREREDREIAWRERDLRHALEARLSSDEETDL